MNHIYKVINYPAGVFRSAVSGAHLDADKSSQRAIRIFGKVNAYNIGFTKELVYIRYIIVVWIPFGTS